MKSSVKWNVGIAKYLSGSTNQIINTKKLQRRIHDRQDEAKWFAVLRVSNLRTRSDNIKDASYQTTASEIKVIENFESTTFNNTLEIKKQLNVQNI